MTIGSDWAYRPPREPEEEDEEEDAESPPPTPPDDDDELPPNPYDGSQEDDELPEPDPWDPDNYPWQDPEPDQPDQPGGFQQQQRRPRDLRGGGGSGGCPPGGRGVSGEAPVSPGEKDCLLAAIASANAAVPPVTTVSGSSDEEIRTAVSSRNSHWLRTFLLDLANDRDCRSLVPFSAYGPELSPLTQSVARASSGDTIVRAGDGSRVTIDQYGRSDVRGSTSRTVKVQFCL